MSDSKTILKALFIMLLWGSLFPLIKLGYEAYSITTTGDIMLFAGIRFVVCGGAITLFVAMKDRTSFAGAKNHMIPVLMVGLFTIVLHYTLTYGALKITDGSKTAILKQIGALFYVCFSSLFFKDDKFTMGKFIGVLAGFAGIVVINADSAGINFNIGDVMIIGASFCIIISNIISKKISDKVNPITITGISQLFGGVFLLVCGIALGGRINYSLNSDAFILIYICIASMVSYVMWYLMIKDGELSKLFIIKFAEPLFACLFSAVLLGENVFTWQYALAFLLIAGGIYISNKD